MDESQNLNSGNRRIKGRNSWYRNVIRHILALLIFPTHPPYPTHPSLGQSLVIRTRSEEIQQVNSDAHNFDNMPTLYVEYTKCVEQRDSLAKIFTIEGDGVSLWSQASIDTTDIKMLISRERKRKTLNPE